MTEPPVRIGPYEVLSRLGVGGMAETYLALRRGPGDFIQRVCLKRIRYDLAQDPEFVRQFMAEAAIAARLRHATIAQVLDFGRDRQDYYLALELVEGLDLRELLEAVGGRLAPQLTTYIAIELATALDFAHRGGGAASQAAVVHRDVSPSNVLVSTEGEIKLTDFGIARSVGGPQHTRTGIVKGKVPYLAPEYARSGRFDPRCDLFALGVVLYECTCGERPHQGATELETLELAARGEHVPLSSHALARDAPRVLLEIIEQLLAPDPEQRLQTAASLLEALLALPGSPQRARRELGALVVQLRQLRVQHEQASAPGAPELGPTLALSHASQTQSQRLAEQAGLSEGDHSSILANETSDIPGLAPRRRALMALAAAALFATGVIGFALLRGPPSKASPTARARQLSGAGRADEAGLLHSAAAGSASLPSVPPSPPREPSLIVVRPEADARPPAGSTSPPSGGPASPAGTRTPTTAPASPSASLEVVVLPYGEVFIDGKHIGAAPATVSLAPGEHAIDAKNRDGKLHRRVSLSAGEHRQIVLR